MKVGFGEGVEGVGGVFALVFCSGAVLLLLVGYVGDVLENVCARLNMKYIPLLQWWWVFENVCARINKSKIAYRLTCRNRFWCWLCWWCKSLFCFC